MLGHHVSAAGAAEPPHALRRLRIRAELRLAARDSDVFRAPKREGIHRPGGPVPAGLAMTVPHRHRLAACRHLDRAAETRTPDYLFGCHVNPPFVTVVRGHAYSSFRAASPVSLGSRD